MDKILVLFLLIDSLVLITSSPLQLKSSPKDERIESFLKTALPFIKQNIINKQEFENLYNLLANSDNMLDRNQQKISSKGMKLKFSRLQTLK